MNPIQYFRFLQNYLAELAGEVGYTPMQMYIAFARCYIHKRVGPEEFKSLRLYRYGGRELKNFLTFRQLSKLQKILNAGATEEEIVALYSKQTFNEIFRDYIHREWLYLPDSSEEDIRAFFARNERSLIKPTGGCQGDGIQLLDTHELDIDTFLAEHGTDDSVLEAFIVQHPAMAELNPSSVNTVRIVTARKDGRVLIVGAGLRIGAPGAVIDNFHAGGSAFPVDRKTGILSGPGRSLSQKEPLMHSAGTGHIAVGFQIPHWDKVIETVTQAALLPEHLGFLAWDVAVTPEGADLVEVNVTHFGITVIQLDGEGAYEGLKEFMDT